MTSEEVWVAAYTAVLANSNGCSLLEKNNCSTIEDIANRALKSYNKRFAETIDIETEVVKAVLESIAEDDPTLYMSYVTEDMIKEFT